MPLISIIVPIFNVERYLEKCIKSVLSQTLRDFELVLINDGSTDNCLEICEKYKKFDNRVMVISQNNSGVSNARNLGLKVAKGKYIGFIDPDDWIDSDMYEMLYKNIEKEKAEISICGHKIEFASKEKTFLNNYSPLKLNPIDALKFLLKRDKIIGSVCVSLYKKDVLNEIFFDEKIKMSEDFLFNVEVFLRANKIILCPGIKYHYRQRNDSAVHSSSQIEHLNVYVKIEQLLKEKSELGKNFRASYLVALTCSLVEMYNYKNFNMQRFQVIKEKMMRNLTFEVYFSLLVPIKFKAYILILFLPYKFSNIFFKTKILISKLIVGKKVKLFA